MTFNLALDRERERTHRRLRLLVVAATTTRSTSPVMVRLEFRVLGYGLGLGLEGSKGGGVPPVKGIALGGSRIAKAMRMESGGGGTHPTVAR